jgi:aminopeptidase N
MSVHCPDAEMSSQWVIAHELAHMWFGDSVSLENWQDIWIKEGIATYAGWLWTSRNDPVAVMKIARQSQKDFLDDPNYSVAEPSPDDLYTASSYTGGALVLQGLRLEVGDETFFDILRAYAERYKYGNAGTTEFIAVAEEVSGKDLKPFFDTWLFSKTVPKLPE